MTVETPTHPPFIETQSSAVQRVWFECLQTVLGQVAGFPITVEPIADQELSTPGAAPAKPQVWMIFSASKALLGDVAIVATEAAALPLAQMLISEPLDPAVAFDKDHRDAYEELIRQVMGQVAINLKAIAGGDVEFKPAGIEAPSWPDATQIGSRITNEKCEPIHLSLIVSPKLMTNLLSAQLPGAPSTAAAESVSRISELSPAQGTNLELLLDVKLDATIRFGQKQMLLREILELHPGTAVALDRQVDEPVELLVGGRMVARGEVVIVDGNYGLRIIEILTPQQRIESLGM